MKTAPHTMPLLFYSKYQEEHLQSTLCSAHGTRAVEAEAPGQAFGRCLEEAPASEQNILIVVQDSAILEGYTALLEQMWPQARILQALNEPVAREILGRTRACLLSVDLILADVDGLEMLESIQLDEGWRTIPVIVLAAHVLTPRDIVRMNDSIVAILNIGVFTVEETIAHISQALAGSKKVGYAARLMAREVVGYIPEHYAEPLTRDTLANVASISSRHLTRCFVREVGIPPMTYLNRHRIWQAMRLLQGGEKTSSEIACAVGFSNTAYFDVVFRREVGLAPSDYRRHQQACQHAQR
jgi:AraC-like DNA-binding protein